MNDKYLELIKKVVNTSNYEQISILDSMLILTNEYKLNTTEVNEIWALIYAKVKDNFNQYCYNFTIK